ncbi:MAG: hypothetical protein AAFO74_11865 [Pseudomonadota bacterium]
MGYRITGREALTTFDRAVARLRDRLAKAIDAADELDHREADVRREQIQRYLALTDIRLDEIADTDEQELDRLHRQAKALLDDHDTYVAEEARRLASVAEKLETLERDREELSDTRRTQLEQYETRVAEIEAELKTNPAYQQLFEDSETAAAIAERAEHKLMMAREELETKGAPYRDDPLFSYLWQRQYRTASYKAMPLFRWLDGWVAKLCKFDEARANFARLNDIPAWLEEHSAEQSAEAGQVLDALEAHEAHALEAGGAEAIRLQAEESRLGMERIDADIQIEETRHGVFAEAHAAALDRRAGPAQEARALIHQGLQRLDIPTLRRMAAETYTRADDELVTDLVELRKEELSMELDADDVKARPGQLKQDLSALERVRRKFKSARYDSDYATFKPSAIDAAITGLVAGRSDPEKVFRKLQRAVKRREPRTNPGFGGARRTRSLSLPDVLGEVAWEVLKESQRGSSIGFPTRSPTRRSSRRGASFPSPKRKTSFPSPKRRGGSSRKGGGWRTGGGF